MSPRAARQVFNLIEDINIPNTNRVFIRLSGSSMEAKKVTEMEEWLLTIPWRCQVLSLPQSSTLSYLFCESFSSQFGY